MTVPSQKHFPFLALPLELREAIYSLYFKPADRLAKNPALEAQGFFGGVYQFDVALWGVNRQLHHEARRVWKRENVFVKISTPWPSAGMYQIYLLAGDGRDFADMQQGGRLNHISSEGLVPIVCTDQRADAFDGHHALVQISAPFHQAVPEHTVLILLEDLHLFTQTWHYSALSYPMLNDRLSTTFTLRDPNQEQGTGTDGSHKPNVAIALQRRLLLPFEQVKGLYSVQVLGYAPKVHQELQQLMALPVPTPQQCCETATDLTTQGDAALAAGHAASALHLYNQAFKAIHILIHGRTRRVLADVFFNQDIRHGRYAGQTGTTVRIMLRLRLVSRTIATYLHMARWDEAAYWGMRSICLMREVMDEDLLSEFPGGEDVGWIYVRTAVAFMKLEAGGEEVELDVYRDEPMACSAALWRLAVRYLRRQDKGPVRRELEVYGVPRETVGLFGDVRGKGESVVAQDGSGEE